MSTQHDTNPKFPADWGQLYALAFAELSSAIESFLEDGLCKEELDNHYRYVCNEHYARVTKLAAVSASAARAARIAARQE